MGADTFTGQKHVMCRACHAHCGLIVDFEDSVPVKTHGDKDNPEFEGYSCIKGRQLANYHSFDTRLLTSYTGMKHGEKQAVHWRDATKRAMPLIVIDPRMSKTAELADYVIAPKLHCEVWGNTAATEIYGGFRADWGCENNYEQAGLPIMESPEGSNLREEYQFIYALASEMDKTIKAKSWELLAHPDKREEKATLFPPGETPDPITAWSDSLNGCPADIAA